MRSFHSDQTHTIDLHFEAVERVELSRTYSGGISIALTRRAGLRGIPLLNLAITSPSGEGLVVCSRVAILRFADEAERGTWPVIQSAMARE
jgi:hypothetical protein